MSDKHQDALALLLLEERQATCYMEHDIHSYGSLSCDYRSWIADIHRRRAEIEQEMKAQEATP